MKKLRISSQLNLHNFPRGEFLSHIKQGLEFNKRAGFDAADFDFSLNEMNFSDDSWRGVVENAILASKEVGLKFEICHLPFSSRLCREPDFVPIFNEHMHNAIDAAAMLGVGFAVLHPNTTTLTMDNYNESRERDSVLFHLAPFAEHAEKVGLNIVIENMRLVPREVPVHRYCQSPDELCEIADTLGIGVCWDFGHANISGVVQSQGLSYVGKRLKVLHINDNTGIGDDHILPFCGTVDWKDAMQGLAAADFNGLLNYELSAGRVPAGMKEIYAAYVVASAYELMSYIP